MAKTKKVPELRFGVFTKEWLEKEYSDIAKVRRGLTYHPCNVEVDGIRVLRSSNIDEDTFIQKQDDIFVNEKAINIDFVKNNDILITSANGSSRLVGKHAIITNISGKVVHGGFMLLATAKYPYFVNASMSSRWYGEFINLYVAGGNGAIGNLNRTDLERQNLFIPEELEQIKVGTFFLKLDALIALHQRKHDKLRAVKKSMLEKMFPKEGADVPEIRFKGFTGKWEKKRIDHSAPLQRGFDLPKSQMVNGLFPVITSNGINGFHSKSKVKGPGVVTGRSGTIGNLQYIESDYWPHNTALWVTDFKGNYPRYVYYMYFRLDLKRFATGSGVPTLNRNDVHTQIIHICNREEQIQISAFFQHLDSLISLHQQELDKLKNIKKACLEKMFV